ncbi:hypothetical protein QTM98_001816, partial [Campylobacter jejuni]|nr:hypothetical protein [Campylobacter jejuni]
KKDEINKVFSKWFVIRNEGFEEFKIYDNRKDDVRGILKRTCNYP